MKNSLQDKPKVRPKKNIKVKVAETRLQRPHGYRCGYLGVEIHSCVRETSMHVPSISKNTERMTMDSSFQRWSDIVVSLFLWVSLLCKYCTAREIEAILFVDLCFSSHFSHSWRDNTVVGDTHSKSAEKGNRETEHNRIKITSNFSLRVHTLFSWEIEFSPRTLLSRTREYCYSVSCTVFPYFSFLRRLRCLVSLETHIKMHGMWKSKEKKDES